MSINRADTRAEASEMKKYVDTIAVIGKKKYSKNIRIKDLYVS
jgi:hypothetical protein